MAGVHPLRLALHPDGLPWPGRMLRCFGGAVHSWHWEDEPLVAVVGDWMRADCLVRLSPGLLGGDGLGMTTLNGTRLVIEVYAEVAEVHGFAVAKAVFAHELGHALGLPHFPVGIMTERITSGPIPVGKRARREAAALRAAGVVGPRPEPQE